MKWKMELGDCQKLKRSVTSHPKKGKRMNTYLFHTLSNIPVHKGTLSVHKIELVVNARQGFSNGRGVGNHTDGTLDVSQVSTRHLHRRLVVDSALESSRTPVDELNRALGLDGGNSGVDILGDNISTVHETACHVLSVARITLGHHVARLKDRVGNLSNGEILVVSLFARDDGGVRSQHEMNTRVGDQVCLKLSYINVQGTI